MNKRAFLKIGATAVAYPFFASLIGCQNDKKVVEELKNWAGNLTYSTSKLTDLASAEAAQTFTKQATTPYKVLGTRHCFNTIADSAEQLVTVVNALEEIVVDAEQKTVTVNAGLKYGQLAPVLHQQGFALHNLASLPHISIAGACATATHGSGQHSGNLATAVVGMELVTPEGEIVNLTRKENPDLFPGAVVHLGALGIVTKMTLSVEPTFQMKQYVYERMPVSRLQDHFDQIQDSGYSVSLFTNWQTDDITEVWIKRKEDDTHPEPEKQWLGATLAEKHMHPIPELSAENCTEQLGILGPWYERMPHFKMGFTPSSGVELQAEYFVPRKHAVEAILAIARLKEQVGPHLFTSEIRSVAADDLWLSPCYKQDSIAIHFTWQQHIPEVTKLLPIVERELAPFAPRPHWGKLFSFDAKTLANAYERMEDFKQLAKQYDPKGKLQNEFLKKNVFVG